MFTTVVVPLDGTPGALAALGPAAALARRVGADVEVVTVTSPGLDPLDDELLLKAACSTLVGVGCAWRVLESNDVASALAGAMNAKPDAILCMATHGRTGIPRAALGSTAEATVRAMTRPVVLIGPHATTPERWDVVQACVDTTSPASRGAVSVAAALARSFGARLWLTEVHSPTSPTSPAEQADVTEAGGLAALAGTLRRDGIDVEWDLYHGDDVVAELLRAQKQLGSTMLVMSTHGRSGIARAALGSITTSLVHQAPCPVLVVPAGAADPTS